MSLVDTPIAALDGTPLAPLEGRNVLVVDVASTCVLTPRYADRGCTAGGGQRNFEKFLVGADGTVLRRFRSRTEPTSPKVVAALG